MCFLHCCALTWTDLDLTGNMMYTSVETQPTCVHTHVTLYACLMWAGSTQCCPVLPNTAVLCVPNVVCVIRFAVHLECIRTPIFSRAVVIGSMSKQVRVDGREALCVVLMSVDTRL